MRVWASIANAKQQSNNAAKSISRRSDLRDRYLGIARALARLSREIDNTDLDVLAYELFPKDVMAALQVGEFHELDVLDRSDVAYRLLPCWASASELLHGLEVLAKKKAEEVMTSPVPDERKLSGNPQARIFIWYLGQDFIQLFGEPMLGSLARIASVVFNPEADFTKSFAQKAMAGRVSINGQN